MTHLLVLSALVLVGCVTSRSSPPSASSSSSSPSSSRPSPLGAFSISLAVKDLDRSRAFYEQLGFVAIGPTPVAPASEPKRYVMLQSGDAVIGLFQGLFDANTLTFNPSDVRAVQRDAKARGVVFVLEVPDGAGPGHAMAIDPDGNPVLFDQH